MSSCIGCHTVRRIELGKWVKVIVEMGGQSHFNLLKQVINPTLIMNWIINSEWVPTPIANCNLKYWFWSFVVFVFNQKQKINSRQQPPHTKLYHYN